MKVLASTRRVKPHKTQDCVQHLFMGNQLFCTSRLVFLNIHMNTEQLLEQGNQHRADHQPEQALECYAQIFGQDFNHGAAFNNYGNVLREMGHPERAIPFLHAAHDIDCLVLVVVRYSYGYLRTPGIP